MPISSLPPGFSPVLLQVLWRFSLLVTVFALVTGFLLVLRRLYVTRLVKRRQVRRKELEGLMWGALSSPVELAPEAIPRIMRDDIVLICDAALDILRPLRGQEAARIVHLLEAWPIYSHIQRMLRFGRRGQRIRMLSLLAHFDDEKSLQLLKRWIKAGDFYVQLAAMRSLAARNAVDALPDILAHLAHAKRQNTTMLADVLQRFGEPALGVLVALTIEAQIEVRLAAIKALTAIGSLDAVEPLIKLIEDPLPEVRSAAVSALGRLGDASAEKAMLQALHDKDENVRVHAAKAAGRLHLHTAAPRLAGMLADPFWWVRYRAAEALHDMGAVGQAFLKVRSKEHDQAGIIAAQVLAEKGTA